MVWFASFQDLNGKSPDGQVKAHNESIHLTDWDCIVLDEYHFGAWRDSARDLYDPTDKELAEDEEPDEEVTEEDLGLDAAHYLYLSGTPFRAITNGEFTEDADLQLDLRRRAGGEGGLGRQPTARTRTSSCRGWRCTPTRSRREPPAGPRTASSTASR